MRYENGDCVIYLVQYYAYLCSSFFFSKNQADDSSSPVLSLIYCSETVADHITSLFIHLVLLYRLALGNIYCTWFWYYLVDFSVKRKYDFLQSADLNRSAKVIAYSVSTTNWFLKGLTLNKKRSDLIHMSFYRFVLLFFI